MKAQEHNRHLVPDKPLGRPLSLLRSAVRNARWYSIILSNISKSITRGKNCYFGKNAEVYVPRLLRLGNNISFGSNLISQVNLIVGDDSLISSRVSFIGNDHELADPCHSAYFSGRLPPSTVILEGDNFVGFGSTILGNVTIGRGAIIGASSFVNRDVPANCVVVGIPAKIVKQRNELRG